MVIGSIPLVAGFTLTVFCALLGALMVLFLLLSVSRRLASATAVLLVGVMLSFIVSSVLSILAHRASTDGLRHYQLALGRLQFRQLGSFTPLFPSHPRVDRYRLSTFEKTRRLVVGRFLRTVTRHRC